MALRRGPTPPRCRAGRTSRSGRRPAGTRSAPGSAAAGHRSSADATPACSAEFSAEFSAEVAGDDGDVGVVGEQAVDPGAQEGPDLVDDFAPGGGIRAVAETGGQEGV